MEKPRSKRELVLTIIVATALVGAVAAAIGVKSQHPLPVHERRNVTMTLAMTYKLTSDRENRQWEAYRREISLKIRAITLSVVHGLMAKWSTPIQKTAG